MASAFQSNTSIKYSFAILLPKNSIKDRRPINQISKTDENVQVADFQRLYKNHLPSHFARNLTRNRKTISGMNKLLGVILLISLQAVVLCLVEDFIVIFLQQLNFR